MDNLFCNPNTCDVLLSDYGHYSAGTHRLNRGVPTSLRKDSPQVKEELKNPGEWMALASKHGLYAYAWVDSGVCNMLSNVPEHGMAHGEVWRRVKGISDQVRRSAPKVAEDYNRYMVAVDKCDQMRGTFTVQRRQRAWWKKLFNWSLEIACVNAWALYKGPMDRYQWTQELIRSLLGEDHASKKKLQPREQHWPVEMKKARCAHCYITDKVKGGNTRTISGCACCGVNLHWKCWYKYGPHKDLVQSCD
eukprot:scaffold1744_cov340-Prasinococcus_capsulatus_cf.AAC.21